MIDCLYNITAILQDPGHNGPQFRKYGYKRLLMALDEDQARYGGKPEWDEWIAQSRVEADFEIRALVHHPREPAPENPPADLGTNLGTEPISECSVRAFAFPECLLSL
jgi:hypothetical protein